MNLEDQLKLQAFLDGELPPDEARQVAGWIGRDPVAAALLAELTNVRQQLHGAEAPVPAGESREFYWSKIAREIQRQSPLPVTRPTAGIFDQLRRLILPATGVVALVLVGLVVRFHASPTAPTPAPTAGLTVAPPVVAAVMPTNNVAADAPEVETTLATMDATTYRDDSEGTTLVWFTNTNAQGVADNGATPDVH